MKDFNTLVELAGTTSSTENHEVKYRLVQIANIQAIEKYVNGEWVDRVTMTYEQQVDFFTNTIKSNLLNKGL